MGLDCYYQALPEGCALLERAVREPEFGEYLSLVPWKPERLERWRAEGGMSAEFSREMTRLCQQHPGLEKRFYTVDRFWDVLRYLLSEARREERPQEDWGSIAVQGAAVLADTLRAGQGVALRYSGRETVQSLVSHLAGISEEQLRQVYEPERMEERAVYKFWADRADAETWQWTWRYFEGLRAFLQQAAEKGEGVLVVLD
jgi:Domain of unknown function (DUF1877)